jgi:hypothetical protein
MSVIGIVQLKIVRSFSIGFGIMSPTLNGFCVEIYIGCFHVCLWSKGNTPLTVKNYW